MSEIDTRHVIEQTHDAYPFLSATNLRTTGDMKVDNVGYHFIFFFLFAFLARHRYSYISNVGIAGPTLLTYLLLNLSEYLKHLYKGT